MEAFMSMYHKVMENTLEMNRRKMFSPEKEK
jgi:hypothetical protein